MNQAFVIYRNEFVHNLINRKVFFFCWCCDECSQFSFRKRNFSVCGVVDPLKNESVNCRRRWCDGLNIRQTKTRLNEATIELTRMILSSLRIQQMKWIHIFQSKSFSFYLGIVNCSRLKLQQLSTRKPFTLFHTPSDRIKRN